MGHATRVVRFGIEVAIAALVSVSASTVAQEATVSDVLDLRQDYQTEAVASQARVEALDDEALGLISEFHTEADRLEDLTTYNANMRELLTSQAQEKGRLERELDEIAVVRQAIVPLMVEMVDVLERFVALDQPMLVAERSARLQALRANLTRSNVDIAERYRRVIEAYQVEAEYGQSIEAYEGPVRVGDRDLTVDFLRVGRVGLFYLSLDRNEAGTWNRSSRSWEPVGSEHLDALDYAVRVARKQAPPNLVRLPLWTETPQ